MKSLHCLPGGKPPRKCPPPVKGDEIYPSFYWDSFDHFKIMMLWTLRFDDVLDPEKLNAALQRLLELDGWRKLGGRLRLNQKNELEIHIPKVFTPQRPAAQFRHTIYNTAIDDHLIASQIPKATSSPTVFSDFATIRDFGAPEDAPRTVEDLLYSDTPQLSLYVSSFSDATIVSFMAPHTLIDGMSAHACMSAWSKVLAGREHEVPPLLSAHTDALSAENLDKNVSKEEYVLAGKRLTGTKLIRFMLHGVWDQFRRPGAEPRIIFLPAPFVARLRQTANADVQGHAQMSGKGSVSFVSEGDVLLAFMTRLVARAQPRPRPMSVINAFEIRSRLKSVFREDGVYVQNLVLGTTALLSGAEASASSLGQIAARIREAIQTQATEPQIHALMRLLRQEVERTGRPFMIGEPDGLTLVCSNWQKAKFFDVIDFSPAVTKAEGAKRDDDTSSDRQGRANPPGKISYHHCHVFMENAAYRNMFIVLGKDHAGNYWLQGTLDRKSWAKLDKNFAQSCAEI